MPRSRHPSAQAIGSRYDKVLHLWPQGWSATTAVFVGAAVYVIAHMLVRLPFTDVIAVDWVGETVYAQTIDWGQTPKYPPLPAWLLWSVHQVTGPGALSTLIVKYAALWAAFAAYFFASRRVLRHDGWAVLATISVLLLFQVAWNAHEGVTHTIFLTLAAPLTLLAVLRAQERNDVLSFAGLSVAIAIGALAKQAYFAGFAALMLAMLVQPGYRRVVLNPRIVLTLLVAAALALPHYYWAFSSGFDFSQAASSTLARPDIEGVAAQIGSGLWSSIRAPLLFLSPLLPVLLLTVPQAFRPGNLVHPGSHGVPGADPVQLVRDATLAGVAVLAVPVLVAGVGHYGERWMHPLMLWAPIYLIAMVRAARPKARRVSLLVGIIAVVTLVALGWRFAGFVAPSPITCGKCRLAEPYAALAEGLGKMGFEGGTILAGDEHIAGNLRTHFPGARVVALNYGYYDPPMRTGSGPGQCLVVWRSAAGQATAVIPPAALAYADVTGLPEGSQVRGFSLPKLRSSQDGKISRFAAVMMPAAGRCR